MSEDRKPVGLSLTERPDLQTRVAHTAASWIATEVIRPLWLWRRELLILALPTMGAGCGAAVGWMTVGPAWTEVIGAGLMIGGTVLATLLSFLTIASAKPDARACKRFWKWLSDGRLRRKWDSAARFSTVETVSARIPRVKSITEFPAGHRLRIRLPRGLSATDIEGVTEKMAVVLDVREVRVRRNPAAARWPDVDILTRNPFRGVDGSPLLIRSPLADAPRVSLWDPVPVGVDAMGAPVRLRLVGRNLLLGGEPEAGKSAALSLLLAAAALDPTVAIYGLDAKMVELSLWSPVMRKLALADIESAISLLDELIAEMDERYAKMSALGVRSLAKDMGYGLIVLAVDELRFFTAHLDRKSRDEFNRRLIDVVARGRAAGVIAVNATQKPSSDVVPTSLRDLHAYRWAMRCSTRDASDTILGAGWASETYSAASIDSEDRGVGLLLAEGALPVEMKSAYLSDTEIARVVARGVALRDRHKQ